MFEDERTAAQPARRNAYKKGMDQEETRRKREETTVQIRRNKKEDRLKSRRQRTMSALGQSAPAVPAPQAPSSTTNALTPELLAEHQAGLYSPDPAVQFRATTQFRRVLSIERSPPIQQVIDAQVVPRFVQFLQRDENPQLQFEAAWALTNIASGTTEHTRVVIEANAVPIFVRLLSAPNEDVREQAAWALGNVAGDSVACRDLVLEHGALPALLRIFSHGGAAPRLSTMRNATWTLSNLCRGKPPPDLSAVQAALPLLAQLVLLTDMETVTDACWALSYISDGPNDRIQAVLNTGVARRLVELLTMQVAGVQTPALRTVGNIVTGDDVQTQQIINLNALQSLHNMLEHSKKNIRKEAVWTISNITAGTSEQIQAVINAGIFPRLIYLLQNAEFDIQKEAAWAVSNATSGGTPQQIAYIVHEGAIPPLCSLLRAPEPRIVTVALEGIENILKMGKHMASRTGGPNQMAHAVIEAGAVDVIQNLQYHDQEDIYRKVAKILTQYFNGVEDEDSSVVPTVDQSGSMATYGFGAGGGAGGAGAGGFTGFTS